VYNLFIANILDAENHMLGEQNGRSKEMLMATGFTK